MSLYKLENNKYVIGIYVYHTRIIPDNGDNDIISNIILGATEHYYPFNLTTKFFEKLGIMKKLSKMDVLESFNSCCGSPRTFIITPLQGYLRALDNMPIVRYIDNMRFKRRIKLNEGTLTIHHT